MTLIKAAGDRPQDQAGATLPDAAHPWWTYEEDRVISEGKAQCLSASQIAERLPGRTRNAVIGRMHRLRSGMRRRYVGQ